MSEIKLQSAVFGLIVAILTVCSCALFLASMQIYPGGNWLDVNAAGHDFARNFLCDVLAGRAQNNIANPLGSALALAGYFVFSGAFLLHWSGLPGCFRRNDRGMGVVVRWAGVASTVAMVAVPLWPPSETDLVHQIAVYASGIPGGIAALLACIGLARAGERTGAWLAASVLCTTLANGLVYAAHTALSGEPTVVLPLLQRVGALSMVAWVLAMAARHLRPAPQTRGL